MATAITILNHELAPLVTRVYKHNNEDDALEDILERFRLVVVNNNIGALEPILQIEDYHYIYVYSNNLILVMVVASRHYQLANVMCYVLFLKKFEDILKSYFKTHLLDQDMIVDNFLLLYELFDEMMDFGFVQITDFNILNEYIKMRLNFSEEDLKKDKTFEHELNSSISRMSTTQLSWRPKGIFYKKNEIFIDIAEKVNLLVDSHNHIKKQLIVGQVKVKCFLSGMPTLRLGLNEFMASDYDESSTIDSFKRLKFDNLNFHQCVELSKFSNDNTISFIPPDGKFVLLTYRLQVRKPPLIKVSNVNFKKKIIYKRGTVLSHSSPSQSVAPSDGQIKETKLLISVDIQTTFTKRVYASDVSVIIPLNFKKYYVNFDHVPRFKTKIGTVVLDIEKQSIVWKISTVNGNREFQMSSEIALLNDEDVPQEDTELLNDSSSESSDSEAEKTYDYYYGDKQDKHISSKAKRLKQVYKTVQKEQRKIYKNKQLVAKSSGPTSPSFLIENPNSIQENLDTITDSPSVPEQPTDINDLFYINRNLVKVNFKIENLTHSGLKITYLKINEPLLEYTSFPWVKYVSMNDEEYGFKFDFNRTGPSETIVKRIRERKDSEQTRFIGGGNTQKTVQKTWKKL